MALFKAKQFFVGKMNGKIQLFIWAKTKSNFDQIKTVLSGDIDPRILAKCDLCQNDPCENGASCRPLPNRDYECMCVPGFYGKNCEAIIDACYGNPCDNGATCKVMEAGRFT